MKRVVAGLAAVILLVLVLSGCETAKISSIVNDPSHWQNKTVRVVGTVQTSMGALGHGAYQVSDGTGNIWVITNKGVPSRGAQVAVEGTVFQGLQFGGQTFAVAIREKQHRTK
jgi:hypothetical protein